jgi:hypothetical protein
MHIKYHVQTSYENNKLYMCENGGCATNMEQVFVRTRIKKHIS